MFRAGAARFGGASELENQVRGHHFVQPGERRLGVVAGALGGVPDVGDLGGQEIRRKTGDHDQKWVVELVNFALGALDDGAQPIGRLIQAVRDGRELTREPEVFFSQIPDRRLGRVHGGGHGPGKGEDLGEFRSFRARQFQVAKNNLEGPGWPRSRLQTGPEAPPRPESGCRRAGAESIRH
jgi:hypothetical protein